MKVVLENQEDKLEFKVGDIVIWNNAPYLVISHPKFSLMSLKGDGLANDTHDTIEALIQDVNKYKQKYEAKIQVYSKEDYQLKMERRY